MITLFLSQGDFCATAIYGPLATEVQRERTLQLVATLAGTEWGCFVDM